MDAETRENITDRVDGYLRERAENNTAALAYGSNEDNRLRCAYIRALLQRGKADDFAAAKEIFNAATDGINFYRPSYAVLEFGEHIDGEIIAKFKEYHSAFAEQYTEYTAGGAQVIPAAGYFVSCPWFAEILT
jgi:hypothetical protein